MNIAAVKKIPRIPPLSSFSVDLLFFFLFFFSYLFSSSLSPSLRSLSLSLSSVVFLSVFFSPFSFFLFLFYLYPRWPQRPERRTHFCWCHRPGPADIILPLNYTAIKTWWSGCGLAEAGKWLEKSKRTGIMVNERPDRLIYSFFSVRFALLSTHPRFWGSVYYFSPAMTRLMNLSREITTRLLPLRYLYLRGSSVSGALFHVDLNFGSKYRRDSRKFRVWRSSSWKFAEFIGHLRIITVSSRRI